MEQRTTRKAVEELAQGKGFWIEGTAQTGYALMYGDYIIEHGSLKVLHTHITNMSQEHVEDLKDQYNKLNERSKEEARKALQARI